MKKYNWRLNTQQIISLYNQGLSCTQIGHKLGATRQAIWEKLKHAGVKRRTLKKLPYVVYDGLRFTISKTTGYYRSTTHRKKNISLHRYKYEKEIGRIPDNWDIHHIDGDKTNNDISNLECLPKAEHTRLYSPHHNQYKNYKTLHLYQTKFFDDKDLKQFRDEAL